jgi:hypothetical protein
VESANGRHDLRLWLHRRHRDATLAHCQDMFRPSVDQQDVVTALGQVSPNVSTDPTRSNDSNARSHRPLLAIRHGDPNFHRRIERIDAIVYRLYQ